MLDIYFNKRFVGKLFFKDEQFSIKYDKSWLKDGFLISPHIKDTASTKSIKDFLRNLLPEGENLESISLFTQISKYNTYDLVRVLADDITGAISFGDKKSDTIFTPIDKNELINRVKNIEYDNIAIWDKNIRLSIAGVGKKLPIMIKDDIFGFGEGDFASTHILKFDKKDLHLVENEYLTLSLAKSVGLNVTDFELLSFEDIKILLVTRFDRLYHEDIILKKHIIDGCQLLDISPEYKYEMVYNQKIGTSISKLSKAIERFTTYPIKEKELLVEWVLFNLIVGNSDAHGKNISFFIERDNIKTTPFYDMLNISLYDEVYETKFAMGIGDCFEFEKLNYSDLLDLAYDLNLNFDILEKRYKKLSKKILSNLNKLPKRGIDREFQSNYIESIKTRVKKLKKVFGYEDS